MNLKYVVLLGGFLMYTATMFIIVRYLIKYPKLRELLLQSVMDSRTKKVSGKSLTAVFLIHIVGFATIIAVVYSKDHILPAYFLDALLLFIASLYGINKIPSKTPDTTFTNNAGQPPIQMPEPNVTAAPVKAADTTTQLNPEQNG